MYYSLAGQDEWVLNNLNFKRDGFFIDLGAGNGVDRSNTYALELDYNWTGLCVEGDLKKYNNLITNRSSINVNTIVNDYNGQCYIDEYGRINDITGTTRDCETFDTILNNNGISSGQPIDYLSVNLGNREYDILKSIDFNIYDIKIITVQHNIYLNYMCDQYPLYFYLRDCGFDRVIQNVTCEDVNNVIMYHQPYEDWYIKI